MGIGRADFTCPIVNSSVEMSIGRLHTPANTRLRSDSLGFAFYALFMPHSSALTFSCHSSPEPEPNRTLLAAIDGGRDEPHRSAFKFWRECAESGKNEPSHLGQSFKYNIMIFFSLCVAIFIRRGKAKMENGIPRNTEPFADLSNLAAKCEVNPLQNQGQPKTPD